MISRKTIYDAHRGNWSHSHILFNHARKSANILSRVSRELDKHSLYHTLDAAYPYHLIVEANGKRLSVYHGGFYGGIDIIPLKKNGKPYASKYERGYATPQGAVNYIVRKYASD